MVDGDDRPSIRYLYDAIHHAKKKNVEKILKERLK
jgi:hypothetical protein